MSTSLGSRPSLLARTAESVHWFADQMTGLCRRCCSCCGSPGRCEGGPQSHLNHGWRRTATECEALLLIFGFVPLGFMTLLGLTSGADLQLHWGTFFFS